MKKHALFTIIIALLGIATYAQNSTKKSVTDAKFFRATWECSESYDQAVVYATAVLFQQEIGDLEFETEDHGTKVTFLFQPYMDEKEGLCLKVQGRVDTDIQEDVYRQIERYQKLLVDDNAKDVISMIEPITFVKLDASNETVKGWYSIEYSQMPSLSDDRILSLKSHCSFFGGIKWNDLKASKDAVYVVQGVKCHSTTVEISRISMQKLLMSIIRNVNKQNYVCDEAWLLKELQKKFTN